MPLGSLICFFLFFFFSAADEISYSKHPFNTQTSEKTFTDAEITTGPAQLPLG